MDSPINIKKSAPIASFSKSVVQSEYILHLVALASKEPLLVVTAHLKDVILNCCNGNSNSKQARIIIISSSSSAGL